MGYWHRWSRLGVVLCAVAGSAVAATPRYRIEYATYFGGKAFDQAREVIVYPDGSVLVGGLTASSGLPTTEGVVQPQYSGDDPALGHGGIYGGDAFLVRLSADGSQILTASYFGGSKQERGVYGMALDSKGDLVIGSATRSADMPTTEGSYQPKFGGGKADMYAAKLAPDLTRILWCTYVGRGRTDWPRGGLGLDDEDCVYLVGGTDSPDFPTAEDAFQRRLRGKRDAAIVKLKPDGSDIVWSTLLGGSGTEGLMGVRVDASGVYVAGHTQSRDFPVTPGAPQSALGGKSDCFFAKLSPDGRRLLYATYLGGRENEFAEHRPHLLPDGSMLLTGVTASPDFPTTPRAAQRRFGGKNDGFLTRLSPDGRRLVFSTFVGGSDGEFFLMPTPDPKGRIFLVGTTRSRDFPVTRDAVQSAFAGAKGRWDGDGVLAILSRDGSKLLYATYLGGRGGDLIRSIALGPKGEVYLVGSTSSPDFPVTANAVQKTLGGKADAFVVKLVPAR